jgi:gas vesicle protein
MLKFLLGVFCGISLGMVIAPASGEETRRQLVHKVEDLKQAGIEKDRQTAREIGSEVAERLYDRAVGEERF